MKLMPIVSPDSVKAEQNYLQQMTNCFLKVSMNNIQWISCGLSAAPPAEQQQSVSHVTQ